MNTRKILISLLFLFSSLIAISQQNFLIKDYQILDKKIVSTNNHLISKKFSNTVYSRWYNYGESIDYLTWGMTELHTKYLFPDSTILINFDTLNMGSTRIHKIADIFDPTSELFNDPIIYPLDLHINTNQSYIVDSIEVYGFYRRKLISVTDTLLIQISVKPNSSGYAYFGPTSPIAINMGTDTLKYRNINFDQANNKFGETVMYQIKVPLTAATVTDSIEYGINVIKIAPNLIIPANSYIVSNIEFIPGYSWSSNQDSITNKNYFQFLSRDEVQGQFVFYWKGDYNSSYILPIDVRYNNAGFWNGKYKPSYAYMDSNFNYYPYIHHLIYYKASATSNFVTQNLDREEDLILYPNPTMDYLNIETQNQYLTYEICNMLGEKIQGGNLFNRIDISGFMNGIYFLTIYDKNNRIVKKEKIVKQ